MSVQRTGIMQTTPGFPRAVINSYRTHHFISKRRHPTYKNHIYKEQAEIPSRAVPYHIITAMSASRENSNALNSDIGRAGYTQNQDKAAITLFNHFLVDVLG